MLFKVDMKKRQHSFDFPNSCMLILFKKIDQNSSLKVKYRGKIKYKFQLSFLFLFLFSLGEMDLKSLHQNVLKVSQCVFLKFLTALVNSQAMFEDYTVNITS